MGDDSQQADIGALFERWRNGESVEAMITPTLYSELRNLAAFYFRSERPEHTLQPTALVHEALIRLFDTRADAVNRAHLVALAARTMRQVLVDHARHKQADKRTAPENQVTMDASCLQETAQKIDILDLDQTLSKLALIAPRAAKVVELRYFGGLTTQEISQTLEVSVSSVEREWRAARAWLRGELIG